MSLRKIVFPLFFLSGFCGLLYQVVWIRLAFSHFGIITPVLSVVISVFMLGLSLGSWGGGVWISKMGTRSGSSLLYTYALVEGLIGIGAFAVPKLFRWGDALLLPSGDINSAWYLLYSAGVITFALLPWCILMGTTFPLMMAFMKQREPFASESSFSFLYGANVIGAMAGAISTAVVWVEHLGFQGTLGLAGCTNFLIAAVSAGWGARSHDRSAVPRESRAVKTAAEKRTPGGPLRLYLLLFVTGFTSMSLEVIWVRNFTPVIGTTVYAFALIVALYLLATWLGSSVYRRHLARNRVLPMPEVLSLIAVFSLLGIVLNDPRLHLQITGVIAGICPLSFLLGYLTPGLVDRYSGGDASRAGRAYAVNIAGCILGPLLASYLFLPVFGAKGSMILMVLPYVVFMGMSFRDIRPPFRKMAGSATAILLVVGAGWARSYEELYPQGLVRRDSTATVISTGSGRQRKLLVNGIGITTLTPITQIMGHLPLVLLREPPRSALVICFGMGTTYRSLLTWDGLQVTAVELVPSVRDAFGYYHNDAAQVLRNPRGRIIIDDGRRFLRRTADLFDVITIDPPPPIEAAGSSLLYAKEFYDLAKKRLRPAGILQQWFPGDPGIESQAVARALTSAFPYVKGYVSVQGWGVHFLASREPIVALSAAQCLARLSPAARKDLVEWYPARTNPGSLLETTLNQEISIERLLQGSRVILSDDRPINEYYLLRRTWANRKKSS